MLRFRYGILYSIIGHFFYNMIIFLYQNEQIDLFVLDYVNFSLIYWIIYCFCGSFLFFILLQNFLKMVIDKNSG